MAPLQRKLRRALGTFKDQTSIGIAKVASNGAPDLEVALVKATSHDETPIEERYVLEIIHLTSFSRGYVNACVAGLAKRLGKTHNWIVAIKALMLTHRLLRDGDSSFEQELLYSSRRGVRVLNLSNFRDDSHSHAWDYSAFVRTYALFLDEKLDYSIEAGRSQSEGRLAIDGGRRRDAYDGRRDDGYASDLRRDDGYGYDTRRDDAYGDDNYGYGYDHRRENGYGHDSRREQTRKLTPVKDMNPKDLLERIPLMQRLLARILACRPTGAARMNRLVQIALYPVVRESFQIYTDICDGLAIVLDAFFEMDHVDCVKAFDIHTKGAKQIDELASFYGACKNLGVCRSSEYPVVQRISEELLETMEDFLRDRSEGSLRHRQKKSPEPQPKSPEPIDDTSYDVNGMKALPAPPVNEEPEPAQEAQPMQKQQSEGDLLEFDNEPVSAEEHGDRLALALFADTGSSNQGTQSGNSLLTGADRPLAGWELALVESSSELSKPTTNNLAGGFNNLLLTSMYDQATVNQKMAAAIPAGSASSVAIPGRPASSFLALPAPVGVQTMEEDPFAASLTVPPPPYVQMSDMRQKQQLLVQEQQTWYQYQRDGMQGYNGLMKFHNPSYNKAFQPYQPVIPYYGASYY